MNRIMKLFAASATGLGLCLCLTLGAAPAQAADYPSVSNLKAFSVEANYMSLPGQLRNLVWQRDGIWLTREESVAIVAQQIATGE